MIAKCFNLSVSVCLSPLGHVADAATGGARGFRHRDRGGAQCEGVCGGGLQTCGEDHCVSAHMYTILFPFHGFYDNPSG